MLSTVIKFCAAAMTCAVVVVPAKASDAAAATVAPLSLQVVAHQDDDLFFLNPDVSDTIAAGLPSVTVYLTAGQLTGDGDTDGLRARNRQRGAQNAYATMAGVSDGNDSTQLEWQGTALPVAGRTVELYSLRARPEVQLIFMNLHDGSLLNIDTGGADDTVVPTGGLVTAQYHYTRADVVRALTTIITTFRPSVLRSQDAEPDRRAGYTVDHTDHVSGARFAREAAAAYPQNLVEINYRDYNIADVPQNLSPAQVARKTQIIGQYYRYDQLSRDSGSGDNWLNRMYRRWSPGSNWATLGGDGLLQAFVVLNGRAYAYAQQSGGTWSAPRALADARGRLAAGVSAIRGPDGRLHLVAHRLSDHHIVLLSQDRSGGTFGASWTDLSSPNVGLDSGDQVGTPALGVNADGRLQVFLRNGGGGLSTIRQASVGGGWGTTWSDLGGTDLQDGLSVVTDTRGCLEVFVSSRAVVGRFVQATPNGALQLDPVLQSSIPPASAPQAISDRIGRIAVAYRRAGNGNLLLMPQSAVEATWRSPLDLGGAGAEGVATVLSPAGPDGRIMLFTRGQRGEVSLGRQTGPESTFSQWTSLGGTPQGAPAAALDSASRAVVFSIAMTGLSVRRQQAAGSDQPFGDWVDLGL